jgi:transaldolase
LKRFSQEQVAMSESDYFRRLSREASTFSYINSANQEELETALAWGAVGNTMNPTHPPKALKADPHLWEPAIDKIIGDDPQKSNEEVADLVTRKMAQRSADLFMPVYEETGGSLGYCAIQSDPYRNHEYSELVTQARLYAGISPNVAPKIPSNEAGIHAVEVLTAVGIPTICTMGFSVAQNIAMAEAHEKGLTAFVGDGPPPVCFVVIIPGILDEYLTTQVQLLNAFRVDSAMLPHAGNAVARHTYHVFRERGYRARLMVGGIRHLHHFTDVVGEGVHITHNIDTWVKLREQNHPATTRILEEVPLKLLSDLGQELPDFRRAYELQGLEAAEFGTFGPCVRFNNFCRQGFTQFTQAIQARRERLQE